MRSPFFDSARVDLDADALPPRSESSISSSKTGAGRLGLRRALRHVGHSVDDVETARPPTP
jgi:hypothetical protein